MPKKVIQIVIFFLILVIAKSSYIYLNYQQFKKKIDKDSYINEVVTNNNLPSSSDSSFFSDDNVYIPFIDHWFVHLMLFIIINIVILVFFVILMMKDTYKDDFRNDFMEAWNLVKSCAHEDLKSKIPTWKENYQKAHFYAIVTPERWGQFFLASRVFSCHFFLSMVMIIFFELFISLIIFLINSNKYFFIQIFIHGIERLVHNVKYKLIIIFFCWFFYLILYFFIFNPLYNEKITLKDENSEKEHENPKRYFFLILNAESSQNKEVLLELFKGSFYAVDFLMKYDKSNMKKARLKNEQKYY